MDSPIANQVEEAMARVREHRAEMERMRTELMAETTTATSKDRMLTAKVGAQGQIVGLTFHTTAYQSMAPAQLAGLVTDTVNEARARMGERFALALPAVGGLQTMLSNSVVGGGELDELLEPLRAMRPNYAEEAAKKQRIREQRQEEFDG